MWQQLIINSRKGGRTLTGYTALGVSDHLKAHSLFLPTFGPSYWQKLFLLQLPQ